MNSGQVENDALALQRGEFLPQTRFVGAPGDRDKNLRVVQKRNVLVVLCQARQSIGY